MEVYDRSFLQNIGVVSIRREFWYQWTYENFFINQKQTNVLSNKRNIMFMTEKLCISLKVKSWKHILFAINKKCDMLSGILVNYEDLRCDIWKKNVKQRAFGKQTTMEGVFDLVSLIFFFGCMEGYEFHGQVDLAFIWSLSFLVCFRCQRLKTYMDLICRAIFWNLNFSVTGIQYLSQCIMERIRKKSSFESLTRNRSCACSIFLRKWCL